MKDPLGVSPSKGNQGTTRGKEKFLLTSMGIEPTTSGLDLPFATRHNIRWQKQSFTKEASRRHVCLECSKLPYSQPLGWLALKCTVVRPALSHLKSFAKRDFKEFKLRE